MTSSRFPPTLVIAGTSSGVGKTTVAVGLMAALARKRGFIVQPFKVGPDFLDGMHHETACCCCCQHHRKCINLDDWLMGGQQAVVESFARHAQGADICIVEGCMGLFDGRDGESDTGSTAAIAKLLGAPVVLVVDASMMARSVAAMVYGYSQLDPDLSVCAVVVNKIGSDNHLYWIKQAITAQSHKLIDNATKKPVLLVGGLPQNKSVTVPERHLGLKMPSDRQCNGEWVENLAEIIEDNLDVASLVQMAKSRQVVDGIAMTTTTTPSAVIAAEQQEKKDDASCRIGIAQDEAFCFYYQDNLRFIQLAGAQLIPFSPIHSKRLPSFLDAIYLGGGYPELYASALEQNEQMRNDVRGFADAGGPIFAECGGLMYLTDAIIAGDRSSNQGNLRTYQMCQVFRNKVIRMTPYMKMFYAQVEFTQENPIFNDASACRGQKFHYSELVDLSETDERGVQYPLLVSPQTPGIADPTREGYIYKNTFGSYYHLHFASNPRLAEHLVNAAIRHSPCRRFSAVSFVSAATEIVFALGLESVLGGVSSVCDAPAHAKDAPRAVVCHSAIDAANRSSEEVAEEMIRLKRLREQSGTGGPPGHWLIDSKTLMKLAPRIAFVQQSCNICDADQNDVLAAMKDAELLIEGEERCKIVPVSPVTLEEIFASILTVASVLDASEIGRTVVSQLKKRLSRIQKELGKSTKPPLRVVSLEGLAPPCTGGGWLPDMKESAGCVDAFGEVGGAKPRIRTWEEILAVDPDVLVLSPCSGTPTRTFRELHLLSSEPCFWQLRCVQLGEVYILDHSLFSRPGPSVVEGIEMLAKLLRGVSLPPVASVLNAWKGLAYKLRHKVEGQKMSRYTTDLSEDFFPCFGGAQNVLPAKAGTGPNTSEERLWKCSVARPNCNPSLPSDRSAHNFLTVFVQGRPVILMFAGEDREAKRNSDVWLLCVSNEKRKDILRPLGTFTWELITCGKTANEDVPTRRSNAAVAACGNHLIVFGGWGTDNTTPLSHCEMLHLDTFCWTHCSVRGKMEPSPRGNPTLVYCEQNHCAILFGGWNGKVRFNDLWCLDLKSWRWARIDIRGAWPKPRTDHAAVILKAPSGGERMLVFGGSVDGVGPSNEFWSLDCSTKDFSQWSWNLIAVSGPWPEPRTSHAMVVVDGRPSPSVVVTGGNSSGAGKSSIVGDAWVWCEERWRRLNWAGEGVQRCRHGMAALDNNLVIYGGFDGTSVVVDEITCWVAILNHSKRVEENTTEPKKNTIGVDRRVQERWEADIPIRVSDLPTKILERAQQSRLPGALGKELHRHAVACKRDTYIDPVSGYSVFTQLYLKRQPCCGNGCRHCPWGHVNVPKKPTSDNNESLDW